MGRPQFRDLSVMIATYQRPIYALRNMHLLDQTGARVHVLDGSSDPIAPSRLNGLSSRVNYVHLPVPYEERMAHAMDVLETSYCVSVSDDDMHLPSGLAASLDALEQDADLVAATGTALAVSVEDGTAIGKLVYDELLDRAVLADDPIERMIEHLGGYLPSTVYAVTRTPVWKRAMRAATKRRFAPVRLSELRYELAVAYAGKTRTVPHLMWLRSSENASHWAGDETPLGPWWDAAKESGERDDFAAYMGRALTDDPQQQSVAAQGALDAIDTFLQALADRVALRRRLSPDERRARWPIHPGLPLAEWGRKVAEQGVAVDDADLAAAIAAIEATPAKPA